MICRRADSARPQLCSLSCGEVCCLGHPPFYPIPFMPLVQRLGKAKSDIATAGASQNAQGTRSPGQVRTDDFAAAPSLGLFSLSPSPRFHRLDV